ncbi:MAG: hypothetical protein LBP70_02265, partial [Mycoplasmataceae bacterium]|nr:hypothetical protein [Mycoplasmataceae bacterium]
MSKRKFTLKTKILTGIGAAIVVGGAVASTIILTNKNNTDIIDKHHITQDRLDNHTNNIVTKYAAMLNYFNTEINKGDDIDINQQCGIFINNVNNFVPNTSDTTT